MTTQEKSGVFITFEDICRYLAKTAKNTEDILTDHERVSNNLSYVVCDLRRILEIFSTFAENEKDVDI